MSDIVKRMGLSTLAELRAFVEETGHLPAHTRVLAATRFSKIGEPGGPLKLLAAMDDPDRPAPRST